MYENQEEPTNEGDEDTIDLDFLMGVSSLKR